MTGSQLQFFGDTIHDRLRYWRQEIVRVSQAELARTVNEHLAPESRVGVTTVSNYERRTEPRASYLGALKRAFAELNLEWLVSGVGRPHASGQRVAEVLAKAQAEDGVGAFGELLRQPGMQRFRVLPLPAAQVMLAFLEEVRLSSPEYHESQSRAFRDFLQRFSHLFFEPFQSPRHFMTRERLSDQELTTYTLSVVAAVRPLVSSLSVGSR